MGKDLHHHHHHHHHRDGFAMERNEAPAKGGAIDVPGELTTPPLTPPREHAQIMVTSEPVNGNRNNVSDSVHASSAHFKSTKTMDSGVGVAATNDAIAARQQLVDEVSPEEDSHSVHVLTRMEAKPPALVVISGRANDKQVEGEEGEGGGQRGEVTSPGNRDHRGEHTEEYQVTGEVVVADQNAYVSSGVVAEKGYGEGRGNAGSGSLQSTTVTSAGNGGGVDDAVTSDDDEEDVEGMDLVLVEEGEEEGEGEGEDKQQNRAIHTTSIHAPRGNAKTVGSEELRTREDPHASRRESPSNRASDAGSHNGHHHHHHHHHRPAGMNGSEERPRNDHTSSASISTQGKKYASSPSAESPSQGGSNDGFHMRNNGEGNGGRLVAMTNAKQAAKVKQFFTTIQQHGNALGSEVAEQVQELIHALMVSA